VTVEPLHVEGQLDLAGDNPAEVQAALEAVTVDRARARASRIRESLTAAWGDLTAAWEAGDHVTLGYGSWADYLEAEFGDLRRLKLDPATRRERALDATARGMSRREAAAALGVSVGSVQAALTAPEPAPADPADDPAPVSVADQAVALVEAKGRRGMTCRELERATRWSHGKSSGVLSRVARQGRIVRVPGEYREGCSAAGVGCTVFVVPQLALEAGA